MKKLTAFVIGSFIISNTHCMQSIRALMTRWNPPHMIIKKEEVDRTLGIIEDFIQYLESQKTRDLKDNNNFNDKFHQVNRRAYAVGEAILKECINHQPNIDATEIRKILIRHYLVTPPLVIWSALKALKDEGRIDKNVLKTYLAQQKELSQLILKLIPEDEKEEFNKVTLLLTPKNKEENSNTNPETGTSENPKTTSSEGKDKKDLDKTKNDNTKTDALSNTNTVEPKTLLVNNPEKQGVEGTKSRQNSQSKKTNKKR